MKPSSTPLNVGEDTNLLATKSHDIEKQPHIPLPNAFRSFTKPKQDFRLQTRDSEL